MARSAHGKRRLKGITPAEFFGRFPDEEAAMQGFLQDRWDATPA